MTSEQRQQIRAELELLGPEAVRHAMVAFEHRSEGRRWYNGSCRKQICCFVTHAFPSERHYVTILDSISGSFKHPAVEVAFEETLNPSSGREALRQECIAFLAEHGVAVEPCRVLV